MLQTIDQPIPVVRGFADSHVAPVLKWLSMMAISAPVLGRSPPAFHLCFPLFTHYPSTISANSRGTLLAIFLPILYFSPVNQLCGFRSASRKNIWNCPDNSMAQKSEAFVSFNNLSLPLNSRHQPHHVIIIYNDSTYLSMNSSTSMLSSSLNSLNRSGCIIFFM